MQDITEIIFKETDIANLKSPDLFRTLSEYVNHLIKTDFEKLLRLLYRIDVSEEKLKTMLKNQPDEEAGKLIASLMIDRQIEKLNFKQKSTESSNHEDEERW